MGLGVVVEDYFDFNGWVVVGIEDFMGFDEFDGCYGLIF